jgi:hypothetical protein
MPMADAFSHRKPPGPFNTVEFVVGVLSLL